MNDRQKKILQKLKKSGHVSVASEALVLGVNEMTLRRDLIFLEKAGVVTRVHGGAVPCSPTSGLDFLTIPPRKEQIAIAKETVKHIEPNSTIMLNTGTTVMQVAKEIADNEIPLTVITNSLAVAIVLYRSKCQVILTGGTLREQWVDLTGPITLKNLNEYYVDLLISGCDGALVSDGFFTSDINLAEIEKKSVEISKRVIIVAESYKFENKSFASFATIDQVDMVISDNGMIESDIAELKQNSTDLVIA